MSDLRVVQASNLVFEDTRNCQLRKLDFRKLDYNCIFSDLTFSSKKNIRKREGI